MSNRSIPTLPHLPGVEAWREGAYVCALRRTPRLQSVDDALEAYENSFRRYGDIQQAYYQQVSVYTIQPTRLMGQQVQTIRNWAESAFERAVSDFEAVEAAFNTWVDNEPGAGGALEVFHLRMLLDDGRSKLGPEREVANG
jgi:hypothetical protein